MRKLIFAAAIVVASLPASAQWVAGGGYLNLSDDDGGFDISLGGVYGSIGYLIETQNNFSIMPELRVGFGFGDDTVTGLAVFGEFDVDVELDSFVALSVRGQYDFESGVYLFAQPSYGRVEITVSGGGVSVAEDDWEFGIGAGGGFKFTEQLWGEVGYELFGDTDTITAGLKFAF